MTELEAGNERIDDESKQWIEDEDVLEADLPPAFRAAMSEFLGTDVATLGEWVAALRDQLGGSIDVEQLCHADDETPHSAVLAGETYHFQCFYDAVALAQLQEKSVDIRTESPAGDVVEARVTGDVVQTTPESAVTSFGVTATPPDSGEDGPTVQQAYGAICPYVKAFPDREAYAEWAADVNAETVALPLEDGMPIAGALVE